MKLGFVGLGQMGRAVAMNLLKAGHRVTVFSRRPETLTPLQAAGAVAVASKAATAVGNDVVFTMVTGTSDVEEVLFGADGIADGAAPGLVIIDMSTVSPMRTRTWAARLAALDVDMLDAPVSGGPDGAMNATLAIMVGGHAAVYARMLPLLRRLGSTVQHMGDHGAGQATKACNQIAQVVAALGVAEALTLAQQYGLEPAGVRSVLMNGLASSRVLERFGARMIEGDHVDGIPTCLYWKDFQIVLEIAELLGCDLQATATTAQYLNRLMAAGRGDWDLSALITAVQEQKLSRSNRA